MRRLGVPYSEQYEKDANKHLMTQAREIAAELGKEGIEVKPEKEIVALIAYLQRLGTDIKAKEAIAEK
jgi:cytochrome c oxidase cbb3-type subunit I/II